MEYNIYMFKSIYLLIAFKLFFALLVFSAIVTEMAVIIERGVFVPANFFSFFTIQINILVVIILLVSALAAAAGKSSRWLDIARAFATVYAVVVGIGFAVLLSGLENVALTAVAWDNIVLHYIMPAVVVVDFVIDRPVHRLYLKKSLLWLAYPLLYAAYTLIRGPIVGWYPYPFLNPETNGFAGVLITLFGLLVLGIILVMLITRSTTRKTAIK